MPNVAVIANGYRAFDACVGFDGAMIADDNVAAKHCVGADDHGVIAVSKLNVAFENCRVVDHWMKC